MKYCIYKQGLYSHPQALKHLTSLIFHNNSPLNAKRHVKGISSSTVVSWKWIKRIANTETNILIKKKKTTLILTKCSLIWHHHVFDGNIFAMFVRRDFQQTNSRHSYGYQLCSSSYILFLYSLVAEFMVRLLKIEKDEMSRSTINLSIATIEGSSEKRSHKIGSRWIEVMIFAPKVSRGKL